ncbi:MAG: SycD/LcrH family type III secretion system chaperone [Chthoniobacterales bacterium]|nr:SycD/LcrH family type III secretion system chaperone [Chthoniobacterales bacterium]
MTDLLEKKESLGTSIQSASTIAPDELLKKATEGNQPIYTTFGLAKKDIEALYITIHNLYERGKYQEALPLFSLMAFYDHQDKRAWMGMGNCYELLSKHAMAILNYNTVIRLDPQDPVARFRIANCWLVEKNRSQALQALDECIRLSAEKKEYSNLHENALRIREALETSKQ